MIMVGGSQLFCLLLLSCLATGFAGKVSSIVKVHVSKLTERLPIESVIIYLKSSC